MCNVKWVNLSKIREKRGKKEGEMGEGWNGRQNGGYCTCSLRNTFCTALSFALKCVWNTVVSADLAIYLKEFRSYNFFLSKFCVIWEFIWHKALGVLSAVTACRHFATLPVVNHNTIHEGSKQSTTMLHLLIFLQDTRCSTHTCHWLSDRRFAVADGACQTACRQITNHQYRKFRRHLKTHLFRA